MTFALEWARRFAVGRRGPTPQLDPEQVLDAAMSVVLEEGLESLTMGRLARALRRSASGLYRYFESKEAILVALQLRAIEGYRVGLVAAIAGVPEVANAATALARVLVAFGYFAQHEASSPAEHRLLDLFLSAPDPILSSEQARTVDIALGGILEICSGTLRSARVFGALSDGNDLIRTHLLWAGFHGLGHFQKRDRILPPALHASALRPAMTDALLHGFGATPESINEAQRLLQTTQNYLSRPT